MAMFCEPNLKNRDINDAIRKSVDILQLVRGEDPEASNQGGDEGGGALTHAIGKRQNFVSTNDVVSRGLSRIRGGSSLKGIDA
jgi:hypothetical protein